jgi:hypothetical protein
LPATDPPTRSAQLAFAAHLHSRFIPHLQHSEQGRRPSRPRHRHSPCHPCAAISEDETTAAPPQLSSSIGIAPFIFPPHFWSQSIVKEYLANRLLTAYLPTVPVQPLLRIPRLPSPFSLRHRELPSTGAAKWRSTGERPTPTHQWSAMDRAVSWSMSDEPSPHDVQ